MSVEVLRYHHLSTLFDSGSQDDEALCGSVVFLEQRGNLSVARSWYDLGAKRCIITCIRNSQNICYKFLSDLFTTA